MEVPLPLLMTLVLYALVAISPAHAAHTPSAEAARLARELDRWSRPLVESGALAGQLIVARNGTLLVERAWGMADRELGSPVNASTCFNVASITKPMTGIIAIQLIEEGRLALADTLGRWLPGFPNGSRITVEHLMRHRAGIPHRVTTEEQESQPQDAASMVAHAAKDTLLFAPGERSLYSSAGYSVLARVLERASGRPYDSLLLERVFRPAGMTRSTNAGARTLVPGRASSYVPTFTGYENAPLKDMSFLVGAGSVWSTARDLHRLMRAVSSGRMGEGPRLSSVRGGRLSWNGSSNGFRAFASYDSASGLEVVWCGNVHTGAPDLLGAAIDSLVRGRPAPAPPAPPARIAVSDEVLRGYEGVYVLENGVRLELRARGGALYANDWALVPVGTDRFHSLRDFGDVRVRRDGAGRIEKLDWGTARGAMAAPRSGDLPAR
jgi:CubicO group peptidase (beta-lactamase class C family)